MTTMTWSNPFVGELPRTSDDFVLIVGDSIRVACSVHPNARPALAAARLVRNRRREGSSGNVISDFSR